MACPYGPVFTQTLTLAALKGAEDLDWQARPAWGGRSYRESR